jgi:ATP-binding protein involved in chromosome partitioning
MDLFLNDDVSPVLWQAPTQKDAYTWRGMMEATAVREFISDTEWGELDFLMIDLPPGTDKLPNLIDLLPQISGTMIVTIPTGISQFVVGKSIHMAASVLNTPVIGLIENMCGQSCPHCGKANDLFQVGLGREQAEKHNIPFLGSIPFDSQLALCADKGKAFMESFPGSSAAISLSDIAAGLQQFVSKNERSFQ